MNIRKLISKLCQKLCHIVADVLVFFIKFSHKKRHINNHGNLDTQRKDEIDLISNKQVRRNLFLLKILKRNSFGLTKSEIIIEYLRKNIPLPSDRTFARDIDELRKLGYKITCGKNYRYRLDGKKYFNS